MPGLNIASIESSLRELQRECPNSKQLTTPTEKLDEQALANLIEGYRQVDSYIATKADLFALGNSRQILELNHVILFGRKHKQREQLYRKQLRLSEHRFYKQNDGGISGLMEFFKRQSQRDPYHLAAGVFIYLMARPQLFIEGNHRTGVLLISYILLKANLPPIVLSCANAQSWFALSEKPGACYKTGLSMWMGYPRLRRSCARWLKENKDDQYLL